MSLPSVLQTTRADGGNTGFRVKQTELSAAWIPAFPLNSMWIAKDFWGPFLQLGVEHLPDDVSALRGAHYIQTQQVLGTRSPHGRVHVSHFRAWVRAQDIVGELYWVGRFAYSFLSEICPVSLPWALPALLSFQMLNHQGAALCNVAANPWRKVTCRLFRRWWLLFKKKEQASKHMKKCLSRYSLEKCTSKSHPPKKWDTTLHPLGWVLLLSF